MEGKSGVDSPDTAFSKKIKQVKHMNIYSVLLSYDAVYRHRRPERNGFVEKSIPLCRIHIKPSHHHPCSPFPTTNISAALMQSARRMFQILRRKTLCLFHLEQPRCPNIRPLLSHCAAQRSHRSFPRSNGNSKNLVPATVPC